MTLPAAALVLALLVLPHLLHVRRAAPGPAAAVWAATLALRAASALFFAVYVVFFVPHTPVFDAVTHWCLEAVVPLLTTRLDVDGHAIGDAAVALPAILIAASLFFAGYGAARAACAVRRLLHQVVGQGPEDALLVGGEPVVLAVAGLTRPRVVVSAGALTALDDDELAAGLAHERGHIARRHRFVLAGAHVCQAVAAGIPGTRKVVRELAFHLERDADRWALTRRHDRLVLAAAICKAAVASGPATSRLTWLGGGRHRTHERVAELLDDEPALSAGRCHGIRALAVVSAVVALAAASVLPATVMAGAARHAAPLDGHCLD